MTRSKAEIALAARTRAYPDAEGCAAEFCCSPGTWLRWVQEGDAPPPIPGLSPPRWRWADVDAWMSDPRSREDIRRRYAATEAIVADSATPGQGADPYLDAVGRTTDARKKGRRRGPAA